MTTKLDLAAAVEYAKGCPHTTYPSLINLARCHLELVRLAKAALVKHPLAKSLNADQALRNYLKECEP
jgi:hypothetical protein